jgi:hypothetical protein
MDRNQFTLRHSSLKLPLNDSMKALSTGFPGGEKLKLHAVIIRPFVHDFRDKLAAVVYADHLRHPSGMPETFEHLYGVAPDDLQKKRPEVFNMPWKRELSLWRKVPHSIS